MDAVRVSALRERLTGTGWLEAVGGFAGSLRRSVERRGASGLLLVGTEGYEPWHLAAHLDDEAAWSDVPRLAPTLVRHRPPAGAPAHLTHDLRRLTEAGRGATVLVVAPEAAGAQLLERVRDARRHGATVLALDGGTPDGPGDPGDLHGLAHERLTVGTAAEEPFDLAQHLVSAAAGQWAGHRSVRDRLAGLAGRLASMPAISRW
ncbi:hypothetical protein [Streptomyces sp. CBMA156]|uniref:hypothetical protein n=1 Tax=Streptomyces sp. CBMA156 TaxID=1930280 RepID=UPI0016619B8F|nr:hypothetical protein [Streptomyces sp. CBMA156]MBD0670573.1 hypothetical protein [Streptomyces sp. CBMA156]